MTVGRTVFTNGSTKVLHAKPELSRLRTQNIDVILAPPLLKELAHAKDSLCAANEKPMKSRNYIGSLRKCVVLCALTALAVQSSFAEIIPASRRITWQAGVVGGIPDRPTVFTTLPAASTLAQINSAIASCPAGQVVQFAAGTYALTGAILVKRNGVVLRGAGPGLTNLRFDSGSDYGNVKFAGTPFNDPNVNQPPNLRDWTAGYAQGSTTITLSSTAGLSVGAMIILDQLNDNIDVNGSGTEGCGYCGRQSGGRVQMQSVTVT